MKIKSYEFFEKLSGCFDTGYWIWYNTLGCTVDVEINPLQIVSIVKEKKVTHTLVKEAVKKRSLLFFTTTETRYSKVVDMEYDLYLYTMSDGSEYYTDTYYQLPHNM